MKNFGRNPILSIGGVLLAALWLFAADAKATQGVAEVKKVVGKADFTDAKGGGPIKEGDILMEGATITTGAGSYVDLDLKVNGNALRVEADSTLALNKLDYVKAGDNIINTQLEVKKGSAVANVTTKLSKASKYEIKTPSGVAGIRGTVLRCGTTRVTCLIGTISFVPLAGGGVAVFINGGNAFSAGALAAVRAGAAESSNLARTATGLTANTSPANQVATQLQMFTAALAVDAATAAGKAGGDVAKAAADTAKAAVADLLQALQQAAAESSNPQVKAAIQAVAATISQNSESMAANAAGPAAGIAVKLNGGSNAEAKTESEKAAKQTTNNQVIIDNATKLAGDSFNPVTPNGPVPEVRPAPPGPPKDPPPPVLPPPIIFTSPI